MRHIVLMLALSLVSLTGQAQSKGNIPQMLERAEKALYSSGATRDGYPHGSVPGGDTQLLR